MFALVLPNLIGMNNDFAPANSFVSFTSEATMFDTANLWFSLNGILIAFASVEVTNDDSVPLGDLPVVFLSVVVIEVFGNSNPPINVLPTSYL